MEIGLRTARRKRERVPLVCATGKPTRGDPFIYCFEVPEEWPPKKPTLDLVQQISAPTSHVRILSGFALHDGPDHEMCVVGSARESQDVRIYDPYQPQQEDLPRTEGSCLGVVRSTAHKSRVVGLDVLTGSSGLDARVVSGDFDGSGAFVSDLSLGNTFPPDEVPQASEAEGLKPFEEKQKPKRPTRTHGPLVALPDIPRPILTIRCMSEWGEALIAGGLPKAQIVDRHRRPDGASDEHLAFRRYDLTRNVVVAKYARHTSGVDDTIRMWTRQTYVCLKTLNIDSSGTSLLAVPDKRLVIVGMHGCSVSIFDIRKFTEAVSGTHLVHRYRSGGIWAMGKCGEDRFVSAGGDGSVSMWSLSDGQEPEFCTFGKTTLLNTGVCVTSLPATRFSIEEAEERLLFMQTAEILDRCPSPLRSRVRIDEGVMLRTSPGLMLI